jgi:hypothetical protein
MAGVQISAENNAIQTSEGNPVIVSFINNSPDGKCQSS